MSAFENSSEFGIRLSACDSRTLRSKTTTPVGSSTWLSVCQSVCLSICLCACLSVLCVLLKRWDDSLLNSFAISISGVCYIICVKVTIYDMNFLFVLEFLCFVLGITISLSGTFIFWVFLKPWSHHSNICEFVSLLPVSVKVYSALKHCLAALWLKTNINLYSSERNFKLMLNFRF